MEMNAKETEFLANLLTSSTISEAIENSNISRTKAYELLNDEAFQSELKLHRRQNLSHIATRMNKLSLRAVDVLEEVLNDKNASARTRSDTAKAVIDISLKLHQNDDMEERINELERHLEELGGD